MSKLAPIIAGSSLAQRRRAKGLTLIEILIAVLVISIGLLGVAALHSFSLRNNYDALMRSHASALAADIADRMRANRSALADYTIDLDDPTPTLGDDPDLATIDIYEWRTALATTLPNGKGQVTAVGTNMVEITISWGERDNEDDDGEDITFVTRTEV